MFREIKDSMATKLSAVFAAFSRIAHLTRNHFSSAESSVARRLLCSCAAVFGNVDRGESTTTYLQPIYNLCLLPWRTKVHNNAQF